MKGHSVQCRTCLEARIGLAEGGATIRTSVSEQMRAAVADSRPGAYIVCIAGAETRQ
jgi:hypothetical protein